MEYCETLSIPADLSDRIEEFLPNVYIRGLFYPSQLICLIGLRTSTLRFYGYGLLPPYKPLVPDFCIRLFK
jgi:hypothetical protein